MRSLNTGNIILISDSDIVKFEKVNVGNTGVMYEVVDKDGNKYFFKPAQSKNGVTKLYRAYIQEAASELQSIVSPKTAVQCNAITIRGMFGAIQEKIETRKDSVEISELFNYEAEKLLGEYVVDYCLCNYDSHERNFIIAKNDFSGVKGIDKEQSFRYIDMPNSDSLLMDNDYNRQYGENPPLYLELFKRLIWENRNIIELIEPYINRLAKITDEQYRKMFEKYAREKSPEGYDELLDKICERRKHFLDKFQ